jgi:hypothetical protein
MMLRQLSEFEYRHLSKTQMGDRIKGEASTLEPAKK